MPGDECSCADGNRGIRACGEEPACDCEASRSFARTAFVRVTRRWLPSVGLATVDATGGILTLGSGAKIPYCVEENRLTVVDDANVRYTLERRSVGGTPQVCAERSAAECTLGKGCHSGLCAGGAICDAQESEATCTNRVGCSWNATSCGGRALACELQDYGTVPGCLLSVP